LTRGRIALALALAAAVGLVVTALAWAGSYAPLRVTAFGPGYGFSKQPSVDDDGVLNLVMRGTGDRVGEIRLVVANTGRLPVTVEKPPRDDHECSWLGKGEPGLCYGPVELRQAPAKNGDGYRLSTHSFRPIRLEAHETADIWVRVRETCHPDEDPGSTFSTFSGLKLVYRYLGRFQRTQEVALPFDIAYVC
jgi:hypothetical protein